MNFYKYTTYGWYDGTTQEYVPYSTHIPLPPITPKSGYAFNWYGDRWEYIQYVDPPDDPFIPEPLFLIQKSLRCLLLDVSLLKKN